MKMSEKLKEENRKIRHLRMMIDLTVQLLYQERNLTLEKGLDYIQKAKKFAITLFPGKEDAFDLIYQPRLMRALEERGLFN